MDVSGNRFQARHWQLLPSRICQCLRVPALAQGISTRRPPKTCVARASTGTVDQAVKSGFDSGFYPAWRLHGGDNETTGSPLAGTTGGVFASREERRTHFLLTLRMSKNGGRGRREFVVVVVVVVVRVVVSGVVVMGFVRWCGDG